MDNNSRQQLVRSQQKGILQMTCKQKKREKMALKSLIERLHQYIPERGSVNLDPVLIAEIFDIVIHTEIIDDDDEHELMLLFSWLMKFFQVQKLDCLEDETVQQMAKWLQIKAEQSRMTTNALRCMRVLIRAKPSAISNYWEFLFHTEESALLKCCGLVHNTSSLVSEENLILLLMCLDGILDSHDENQLSPRQENVALMVADILLYQHYEGVWVRRTMNSKNIAAFLLYSMKVLKKIIILLPAYVTDHASELFGLAKEFLHFGMRNRLTLTLPQRMNASQTSLYNSSSDGEMDSTRKVGGKVTKLRKPRAVVKNRHHNGGGEQMTGDKDSSDIIMLLGNDSQILSSDSELSSSDNDMSYANALVYERQKNVKVRLASIALMGVASRLLHRHDFYGYWQALFPTNSNFENVEDERCDMLFVGYNDPSVYCRSAALQLCAQMLYGSKPFLSKAESDKRRGAATFIPFATSLATSIRCIYRTLSIILASEAAFPVLTQALKCLAVLIQATPFHQIEMGFVAEFVPYVKVLLSSRDCTLQVSALMVMEFLVATPVLTEEIACLIGLPMHAIKNQSKSLNTSPIKDEIIDIAEDEEEIDEDLENENETTKTVEKKNSSAMTDCCDSMLMPASLRTSWLLRLILDNLELNEKSLRILPTPVRIECLQVMVAMSKHFTFFEDQLPRVCKVLQYSFEDPKPDVRLYAGRCLDSLAYELSRHILRREMEEKIKNHIPGVVDTLNGYLNFWTSILNLIYTTYSAEHNMELPSLKTSLCDTISNMGVTIYKNLPSHQQTCMIAFLSGCASEDSEDMNVRAAAVRALAVFVLFPSLKKDLVFVENIAELALRLTSDSNLNVRIKVVWSLGNISVALGSKIEDRNDVAELQCIERFSDELLRRLISSATESCSDNDKVRSNAVRSLGNLLRLVTESHLNRTDAGDRILVQRAISKLVDCLRSTGTSKVKWNACYALSVIMKNRALFEASESHHDFGTWQSKVYPAICNVIVRSNNFKVRINATAVILNIEKRNDFGTYYDSFWSALLAGIEQSHNLDSYLEYNHRDCFQEQLCLAMAHMLTIAKPEDYVMIRNKLVDSGDLTRNIWLRVNNRMVPEKSAPLVACTVLLMTRCDITQSTESSSSQSPQPINNDGFDAAAALYIAEAFRLL